MPDIKVMLHIAKLAVGIRDIAHLREVQAARAAAHPPLRHQTRNFPRRAHELCDGGSLYWVVAGTMLVRQRVLDVTESTWDDGSRCAALILDPELVPVAGRPTKAFQGWRYLDPEAAPPDLSTLDPADGEAMLPPKMRQDLRALGLL
jgi:hypothetical protein